MAVVTGTYRLGKKQSGFNLVETGLNCTISGS